MAITQLLPVLLASVAVVSAGLPVKVETRTAVTSRLSNVHLSFEDAVGGAIALTYGSCASGSSNDAHHVIGEAPGFRDTRIIWTLPEETTSDGCISAWSEDDVLVGRSEPQPLLQRHKRRAEKRALGIKMNNESGIDALGAWFEGVELLKDQQPGPIDVEEAKSKEVAIVGAGMAGLMSFLILHQAGLKNVKILEAGERLGGRVHTSYLSGGPFDYSYQEMGPMRFPSTYKNPNTGEFLNISDHQLVFQLGEEMNRINGYDGNLNVDFIPWIQTSDNGLVYQEGFKLPSGLPPTSGQISANASLGTTTLPLDESATALADEVNDYLPGPEFLADIAKNMFKAHKDWIVNGLKGLGGDSWSEFSFMLNHLGGSLNDTDVNDGRARSYWVSLVDRLYFAAGGTFKTIDGGLSRLPLSFHPLVDNVTSMNTKIESVKFAPSTSGNKVHLQWRDDYTSRPSELHTEEVDYAIIAAPFSVIKRWRMPPTLPTTISNAISKLPYSSACKVALEFSERFWEHYENPIIGSCSTSTDLPGIGSICYPSYNINGSGPASLLASYATGDWGWLWLSASEDEHVQYVLDAMVDIHGEDTRELYTGKYDRKCWFLDPLESGGWVSPTVGQHELYIPEYFQTYDGLIFVGEHTSYTHAWVSSALESGIRGGVQLLLELGLVDEAKEAVNKWMARWIDI